MLDPEMVLAGGDAGAPRELAGGDAGAPRE